MKETKDILIIDDEMVVVDSVIKIGGLENLTVDFANDSNEAFKKLAATDYNLIICDIMLPEIDGFGILNELRKRNIDTPVVMTTGYSTIENAVKSLYGGAIDFIPKPFTIDEMISTIRRGLKYNQLQQSKIEMNDPLAYIACPPKYFRLGYSCWVNQDYDGSVFTGATDSFVKTIEPIKSIELLDIDENVTQASPFVKFTGEDDIVYQLYSAISGRIIARNEKLINNLSLLEKDPYFEGWLYRMIPNELDFEKKLLTPCSSDRT
jgi:CheY-like chemotaxis protein/glycine cleavage system H lipoate-binding protein